MSKSWITDCVTFLFFKKVTKSAKTDKSLAQCHGSPLLPAQDNCFDEPAVLISSDLLLQSRSRRSETTSKRKLIYSCILFHACTVSGTLQLPQKFCEIQTYWASLTQIPPFPMTSLRPLTDWLSWPTKLTYLTEMCLSGAPTHIVITLITFSANEIAFREDRMF